MVVRTIQGKIEFAWGTGDYWLKTGGYNVDIEE